MTVCAVSWQLPVPVMLRLRRCCCAVLLSGSDGLPRFASHDAAFCAWGLRARCCSVFASPGRGFHSPVRAVPPCRRTFKFHFLGKIFRQWRANVRFNMFCQQRSQVSKSLFFAKPAFCSYLVEIRKLASELNVRVLCHALLVLCHHAGGLTCCHVWFLPRCSRFRC